MVSMSTHRLTDFGKPGNYFERGSAAGQWYAPRTEAVPDMERLILAYRNMPADDGQVSLVHGDFRLDNMIFAKDALSVIAVLDWVSTLGRLRRPRLPVHAVAATA
jgi:aminoglycoside phosphotransferase (APT) family kinase protein